MFLIFVFVVFVGVVYGAFHIWGGTQPDELQYTKIADNFNYDYLTNQTDTKPIFFLSLEKLLGADILKTRLLNFVLIGLVSLLLYSISKNKLSFVYVIIPISLLSMWLTVEIIEIFFILMAFKYKENSGYLIGLATTFRPYAALYFFLLDKKQKIQFVVVGVVAISILVYFGLFESYTMRLFAYGTERIYDLIGFEFIFLIVFLIIGLSNYKILGNSKLWQWQIISVLPLYIKLYGHYFMTPMTLLFLGYLIKKPES